MFGFCLALVTYNVLGVVQGALRAVHGAAAVEELSAYQVADEIAGVQQGMMIAVPAEEWCIFRDLTVAQFVGVLRELAARVDIKRYQRKRRGPKKPPVKRTYDKRHPHVATAKLLWERKQKKANKARVPQSP